MTKDVACFSEISASNSFPLLLINFEIMLFLKCLSYLPPCVCDQRIQLPSRCFLRFKSASEYPSTRWITFESVTLFSTVSQLSVWMPAPKVKNATDALSGILEAAVRRCQVGRQCTNGPRILVGFVLSAQLHLWF